LGPSIALARVYIYNTKVAINFDYLSVEQQHYYGYQRNNHSLELDSLSTNWFYYNRAFFSGFPNNFDFKNKSTDILSEVSKLVGLSIRINSTEKERLSINFSNRGSCTRSKSQILSLPI